MHAAAPESPACTTLADTATGQPAIDEATLAGLNTVRPPDAWLVACGESPAGSLAAAEQHCIGEARDPRRRHFRAGRIAARTALQCSGAPIDALGRRDNRAPDWPAQRIGSISHTSGLVVAMVGDSDAYCGMGVDVEYQRQLSPRAAEMIQTAEERALDAVIGDTIDPILRFSAKEAIYKCLTGFAGGPALGFRDVEVRFSDNGCWQAQPARQARHRVQPWPLIHGRWLCLDTHRITTAWVTAGD